MGYTHYIDQKKDCPQEEWELIGGAFKELRIQGLLTNPLPIQYESDDPSEPEVNDQHIRFNGIGNDGHETFYVTKAHLNRFNFCKTNQKPYDTTVVALLCFMHHFAPDVWEISSDGMSDDWEEGLKLARTVLPQCKGIYDE